MLMCSNCSELKVLNSLMGFNLEKSGLIRGKVVMCFEKIVERLGGGIMAFGGREKLVEGLVMGLGDAC